jgi:hypothetical protein
MIIDFIKFWALILYAIMQHRFPVSVRDSLKKTSIGISVKYKEKYLKVKKKRKKKMINKNLYYKRKLLMSMVSLVKKQNLKISNLNNNNNNNHMKLRLLRGTQQAVAQFLELTTARSTTSLSNVVVAVNQLSNVCLLLTPVTVTTPPKTCIIILRVSKAAATLREQQHYVVAKRNLGIRRPHMDRNCIGKLRNEGRMGIFYFCLFWSVCVVDTYITYSVIFEMLRQRCLIKSPLALSNPYTRRKRKPPIAKKPTAPSTKRTVHPPRQLPRPQKSPISSQLPDPCRPPLPPSVLHSTVSQFTGMLSSVSILIWCG